LKSLNHGAGLGREGGGSGRELIPLGPLLYLLVTCPCGHLTAGLTAGQSSANRGWNTRRSDYLIRFVFVCTCRLDSTPLLILLIKGISNRRWLKTKDVGEDSWRDMSAALSAKSQFPSPPGASVRGLVATTLRQPGTTDISGRLFAIESLLHVRVSSLGNCCYPEYIRNCCNVVISLPRQPE
jgi:hypothetical protein